MFYITVKDRYMRKLGIISNDIPRALHFRDDKQHEFLAEGAETFEITIEKYMNGLLQENIGVIAYGNILSFYDENSNPHVFMIQHPIETRRNIKLQCTSLNLELINEQVGKYASATPLTFFQYLNNMDMLINSSMQLNINEVSNIKLALTFDTQETKLARLLNLVNSFDAECEMLPILTTEGDMDYLELNIYLANDGDSHSGVGRYRNDVLITIGRDVQDITRDVDGTNMFNATEVTGQNGERFTNTNVSILNDDGEEEFYIRPGSSLAFAPLSKMRYPATTDLNNTDGWTRRDFSIQATSPTELADYAIKMLKIYAYPIVTYSLTTSTGLNWDRYNLHIGDTIKISDMKFDNQGLVLSARVTEKVTSRANPNLNSIVFSNFVQRKVQISTDLQNLIAKHIPYNINILTDNGTTLKKGESATTLSVYMSKGQDLDTQIIPDSYEWSMNGTKVSTSDAITLSYDSLPSETNLISVQTTINSVIVGSAQITITKLTDGTDGRSIIGTPKYKYMVTQSQVVPSDEWSSTKWSDTIPIMSSTNKYLWQITQTLYTAEPFSSYTTILNSVYGDNGNDGIAGKDGIGLKTTVITYAISTNGTTAPTNSWTSQVPTLIKGQYLWTKTVWTYTDNSSETGYSVTYISKDGNNGTDGIAGKDGVGITATSITYVGSTSGTTAPTTGWTPSVPSVPAGQFLWTKTVWRYSDNTSETGYSVAMMGPKGDKGDQGLRGIQGADGTQGVPGPKGADGKTQYTHIAYANIEFLCKEKNNFTLSEVSLVRYGSDSRWVYKELQAGTYTATTTLFGSNPANGTQKNVELVSGFSTSNSMDTTHIGIYVDFVESDSVDPSKYNWTLVKGADGTQGTPGKPGADGKTPYFHTAWSYSADGMDDFTMVYPNSNLEQNTKMLVDKNNNLLWGSKGSATATMTYEAASIPNNSKLVNGMRITKTGTGQSGWRSPNGANGGSIPVVSGEKYTASVYLKNNTSTDVIMTLQLGVSATANQARLTYLNNPITVPANSGYKKYNATITIPSGMSYAWCYVYTAYDAISSDWSMAYYKLEPGSTATPHMPSSSEVTTADWPSYIGQYTDFTQADSTNSSDYTWSLIRGNDGKDGQDGKDGTNGKDGDPGTVVSNTEPAIRFKGLTWKYSGTTDLKASDGTVIKPNIEYYFNGSKWVISLIEANQINVDTLAAISAYLGHVYAAIVEDKQSNGSGFLLDSANQLLRVNKTANTYNQIFSEGLTTFAKISDVNGIGNVIPGANYISAILAGNYLQFGQYSTAVNSNGVPVGGKPVGLGTISFGQTSANSYGFALTGDLTVTGNIKSLKDTDWIDIPPASGWGGTMRYMIAEGKFYLRLTSVTNPAVPATTAKTMCTIPTTAVPLGGIRGIPILSYGEPIAELVINANGTIQFYSHNTVGTGHSLHVFVQGIPLT